MCNRSHIPPGRKCARCHMNLHVYLFSPRMTKIKTNNDGDFQSKKVCGLTLFSSSNHTRNSGHLWCISPRVRSILKLPRPHLLTFMCRWYSEDNWDTLNPWNDFRNIINTLVRDEEIRKGYNHKTAAGSKWDLRYHESDRGKWLHLSMYPHLPSSLPLTPSLSNLIQLRRQTRRVVEVQERTGCSSSRKRVSHLPRLVFPEATCGAQLSGGGRIAVPTLYRQVDRGGREEGLGCCFGPD